MAIRRKVTNGFSADDAFYTTANALRFWIKESCGQGYDFMYLPNGCVRVKSGGESVWNWCMEVLISPAIRTRVATLRCMFRRPRPTLTMDSNAQAFVCGLPAAKYRLIESVVPSGFFPAPAQDFTLLPTHTSEKPLELTVTNTPEVKLGLDSDKWDDVLLIGGGVLLAAGAAFFLLRRRKRRTAR